MKKFVFIMFLFFAAMSAFSQNSCESLKNYKYVIIDYKVYPNGNKDIYQIGLYIYEELTSFGFTVLTEGQDKYPDDFTENPCLAVICSYDETFDKVKGNSVTITFKSCKDEMVYTGTEKKLVAENTTEYYQYAAKDVLKPIKKMGYSFNPAGAVSSSFWGVDTSFKILLKRLKFIS